MTVNFNLLLPLLIIGRSKAAIGWTIQPCVVLFIQFIKGGQY